MRNGLRTAAVSVLGLVLFWLVLFVPAGTLDYWQGWAFLASFVLATTVPTVYLMVRAPATLERRLRAGRETRPVQRVVIGAIFVLIPAIFVFSALDHRLGWSPVPAAVSVLGDVLVVAGLGVAMAVTIQNGYAAANVTVEAGQHAVTTGLYGVVRHPMYTGALLIVVGAPLALDSWWGVGIVVPVTVALVVRILDEEKMLEHDLDGYRAYMTKTRYRLVPHAW